MSLPLVPVDNKRGDWPRIVANIVNALARRTDWLALGDYADDAAAAAGGVAVGQLYRTGSIIKVRVA